MWTAKIVFDGSSCTLGKLCKETKVSIKGYPLHHSFKKNELNVVIIGTISGEQNAINKFVKIIQNSDAVKHFEISGNLFVCKYIERKELYIAYSTEIISLEPYTIDIKGIETMLIASFEKEQITRVYKIFNKLYTAKLKFVKQEELTHLSFISKSPKITDIQKDAMIFAANEGYYDFPRRIALQDLAKKKNLSFSTFQAHLRKAEHKLIPFWLK